MKIKTHVLVFTNLYVDSNDKNRHLMNYAFVNTKTMTARFFFILYKINDPWVYKYSDQQNIILIVHKFSWVF